MEEKVFIREQIRILDNDILLRKEIKAGAI